MHVPAHRHAFVKPPRAARRPTVATWHGVELVDDYAWLKAEQLAGRDARARRARRGDPRLPRRRERLLRGAARRDATAAGRAVRRDARPSQGGRQLGPRARWTIRLLHQASSPEGSIRSSAAVSARARTSRFCSTAMSRPRARPIGISAASSTAPTTSCSPTPATTRARSSTPFACAISRLARICPTASPTRAAASCGRTTARHSSMCASTSTTVRCSSTATSSARRSRTTSSSMRRRISAFTSPSPRPSRRSSCSSTRTTTRRAKRT